MEADGDARQKFENRYFRPEPGPNRSELQSNRARADHQKFGRRFRKRKRFGAANDRLSVKLREWQLNRRASGSDNDIFRFDLLRLSVRRFDRNFPRRGDGTNAFERRDLVRFHERANTAVHCFYDLVFALLHLRKIDTCVLDHDAVFSRFLFCEYAMIARGEQRLARDAADVQASAAKLLVLLNNGGL